MLDGFTLVGSLYYLLDLAMGGDLYSLLDIHPIIPEDWARFYAASLSLALRHMHKNCYVYRWPIGPSPLGPFPLQCPPFCSPSLPSLPYPPFPTLAPPPSALLPSLPSATLLCLSPSPLMPLSLFSPALLSASLS